jgi:serine/threonine protein kinase
MSLPGQTDNHVAIIEEYAHLGNIHTLLHTCTQKGTRIQDSVISAVATQVCSAMCVLHQHGVTHANLRSTKVLVFNLASADVLVKICGHEHSCCGVRLNQKAETCIVCVDGVSLALLAPEVVKEDVYSEASDVYAFGVLLWEMWSLLR